MSCFVFPEMSHRIDTVRATPFLVNRVWASASFHLCETAYSNQSNNWFIRCRMLTEEWVCTLCTWFERHCPLRPSVSQRFEAPCAHFSLCLRYVTSWRSCRRWHHSLHNTPVHLEQRIEWDTWCRLLLSRIGFFGATWKRTATKRHGFWNAAA
jgi:hypothetical protein